MSFLDERKYKCKFCDACFENFKRTAYKHIEEKLSLVIYIKFLSIKNFSEKARCHL